MKDTSVSIRGTAAAEWDKNTWIVLEDLVRNHPDAGVHFQGMWAMKLYSFFEG
jgi:hypothetical protein